MTAYDVIGDVHGHADALEQLLAELGYGQARGAYRHPERRIVVFIGDLIDRGPDQLRTLDIAWRMVDAGSALVVLGNHEFNAVAWATRSDAGDWCRPHSDKNRSQHAAFLAAVGEDSARHREWIRWFEDVVLKGPETDWAATPTPTRTATAATRPASAGGTRPPPPWPPPPRSRVVRPRATAPRSARSPTRRSTAMPCPARRSTPRLYGHYWRSGPEPTLDNPRAACLDWSIAKGGQLVAYRWSGEPELTGENLRAVP